MNAAIDLHHRLIRDLLRHHFGYESATEGDSFIAAFHTPSDAVAFSCALQLRLLEEPWPQALLEHPSGAAVWVASQQPGHACGGAGPSMGGQLTSHHHHPFFSGSALASSTQRPSFLSSASVALNLFRSITRSTGTPATPRNQTASHLDSPAGGTPPTSPFQPGMGMGMGHLELNGADRPLNALPDSAQAVPAHTATPHTVHQFYANHYRVQEGSWEGNEGAGTSSCGPTAHTSSCEQSITGKLVFRGLRVRLGLHTGISSAADVIENKVSGRVEYAGVPLALAKAVSDAGHGGMVLLSGDTFAALPPNSKQGLVLNLGDVSFTKDSALPPTTLYQVCVSDCGWCVPRVSSCVTPCGLLWCV